MELELHTPTVVLDPGALIKLRRASGLSIRCVAGRLWITQEGLLEDEILTAGQGCVLHSRKLTIIEALERTTVTLVPRADTRRTLLFRSVSQRIHAMRWGPTHAGH